MRVGILFFFPTTRLTCGLQDNEVLPRLQFMLVPYSQTSRLPVALFWLLLLFPLGQGCFDGSRDRK